MKYRRLGKTSLQVSVIGLGTHQFSGEWAKEFSAAEVEQLLERAEQLGINFLDTAECYGNHSVETLIGKSIRNRRQNWFVATKFGHSYNSASEKSEAWSATEVRLQLEDSLRALQTDYVDLYQFHSGSNAAFRNEELWTMLNNQVHGGKIRFLGISLAASLMQKNDLEQIHSAQHVNAKVIQLVYNRLQPVAAEEVLPFCERHGLGVLARVPLAKGFLSGNYEPGTKFPEGDTRALYSDDFNNEQLELVEQIKGKELPSGQNMAQWALAWCLKHPAVSAVVVGSKSIQQLELNAGATDLLQPTPSF